MFGYAAFSEISFASLVKAGEVYTASIAESAKSADSVLAILFAATNVNETTTAADNVISVLVGVGGISEAATALDSTASVLTSLGNISESVSIADATDSALAFLSDVAESITLTDTTSGDFTFFGSLVETVSVSDQVFPSGVSSTVVTESIVASDSTKSIAGLLEGTVSEVATITDQAAALLDASAVIQETISIVDAAASILTAVASVVETTVAQDEAASKLITVATVSETTMIDAASTGTIVYGGILQESVVGVDVAAVGGLSNVNIFETVDTQDTFTTVLKGVAFISETALANDSVFGSNKFKSNVTEIVTITDDADRRLLWEIINTYQAANWQNIKTVN